MKSYWPHLIVGAAITSTLEAFFYASNGTFLINDSVPETLFLDAILTFGTSAILYYVWNSLDEKAQSLSYKTLYDEINEREP